MEPPAPRLHALVAVRPVPSLSFLDVTVADRALLPKQSVYFHAFAASVAQASLVIKSPRSMLAPHSWSQLNEAVATFEVAGAGGAPVASFVPRLHVLREKAYLSLQNVISVPLGLGSGRPTEDVGDALAEGTDASRFILGPPTRLERRQRKKTPAGVARSSPSSEGFSPDGASPSAMLARMLGGAPALSAQAPPVAMLPPQQGDVYHPLDSPILPRPPPPPPAAPAHSTQAAAAAYLSAHHHPAQQGAYPPPPPSSSSSSYLPHSAVAPSASAAQQQVPPPTAFSAPQGQAAPLVSQPYYPSQPATSYPPAPSPLFTFASFATDFPLQGLGAGPASGPGAAGAEGLAAAMGTGEQLDGGAGTPGGETWSCACSFLLLPCHEAC